MLSFRWLCVFIVIISYALELKLEIKYVYTKVVKNSLFWLTNEQHQIILIAVKIKNARLFTLLFQIGIFFSFVSPQKFETILHEKVSVRHRHLPLSANQLTQLTIQKLHTGKKSRKEIPAQCTSERGQPAISTNVRLEIRQLRASARAANPKTSEILVLRITVKSDIK